MSRALDFLEAELEQLRASGLFRDAGADTHAPDLLNLCSNDYLGFARLRLSRTGSWGAGASRLVFGDTQAHREAERALASWLGCEAALLFSSGYAANVGLISSLCRPGDLIVSDQLNHASIIDGCRLSRATVRVVPHLDLQAFERALREGRSSAQRWVVTESYFGMDGDVAPLAELRALCDEHGAGLLVDEAHALGVFGAEGAGLSHMAGVVPDAMIGTLGKAFGLSGAFVCGTEPLRSWLWNRARSFVFSTGVSPVLADLVADRVAEVRSADSLRAALARTIARLRAVVPAAAGEGHVLPFLVGDPREALRLAQTMRSRGGLVQAIRPPTVPAGSARLRLTACASWTEGEVALASKLLQETLGECFT